MGRGNVCEELYFPMPRLFLRGENMTNEQIAKAIQAGESHLIEQLWKQCYPFIRKQARRWKQAWNSRTDVDIEDLTQSGYFAICAAVDGWDASKGLSFLGYLEWCLKTEFATVCSCRTGTEKADPIYSAMRFESPIAGDTEGHTVAEILGAECPELEEIEEKDFREYISKAVREAVAKLPENYGKAVAAHYLEGVPYTTIAESMGVSISRAQQLGQRGLRKIRENRESEELRKLYFGERNLYRGTGYISWKNTGISAPEREAMRLEMLSKKIQQ